MRPPLPVLLSVHDVLPQTLPQVRAVLAELEERGFAPEAGSAVYLLVVPGPEWPRAEIAELHRLADRGYLLAGHGWMHRVEAVRGVTHRLYARLISRRTAEHLDLDAKGIAALIERSYGWFGANGFAPPALYVPPAWALGNVSRAALRRLPFRWYEALTGVYDARDDAWHRLPVVGYEADTRMRAVALRVLNHVNVGLSRSFCRTLRLSIHPYDLSLLLSGSLQETLRSALRPIRLETL